MFRTVSGVVGLLLALLVAPADARSFLHDSKNSTDGRAATRAFQTGLSDAMGDALGCGGHVDDRELARIKFHLAPMWRTLPKNSGGNVERRSLRYAIHRYFHRHSALQIRGFEPSRSPNAAGWGSDDILGQRVPAFVESVLESKHKLTHGFTLSDAVHMVATIEQLIFDWESHLLERVYQEQDRALADSLSEAEVVVLLETYMVYWFLRADAGSAVQLLSDRELLELTQPQWPPVSEFITGQVRALEHKRTTAPVQAMRDGSAREGHNALSSRFSFEDAHRIIGSVTKSFAGFWDSECATMKASLFEMDDHRTGRVPLSKFYGTGLEADWRFGESEAYLRELGALDESSWRGKQVIISNYMQGASNCVISTPHYLVCCINDCEPLLHEIEVAIGAPSANPEKLLSVVGGMAAQSTLDDDSPPALKGTLTRQLEQIAAAQGGEVPLHGRLFAQWLHYAFPRECAFPHKVGVATSITPSEYGESFYASREEMRMHMAANSSSMSAAEKEDSRWMSQWSPDEELIAEHAVGISAPWELRRGRAFAGVAVVGSLSLFGVVLLARVAPKKAGASFGAPCPGKQHFV